MARTKSNAGKSKVAENPVIPDAIRVFGARAHNLQGIDVEIPLGRMTVITGVSGSGKSSLAFDTIFAEGRCRYLSSVSARSRELLQAVDRPDVDFIDNLPPVLCVEQQVRGVGNRATVATDSDIYDFLKLVFARAGRQHCPQCLQPVVSQSRAEIFGQVSRLPDRQKIVVLAPIVRQHASDHAEVFPRIIKDGYIRARVDGIMVDAAEPPDLDESIRHDIEIVVDRLVVKEGIQSRLRESVDLALQLGEGRFVLSCEVDGQWVDRRFSAIPVCEFCGTRFPELQPRNFSFNTVLGACPSCRGLGISTTGDSPIACPDCLGTRLNPVARAVLVDGISIADFCSMPPVDALKCVNQWSDRFLIPHVDLATAEVPSRSALRHLLPEISTRLRFLSDIGLDYLTLDRSCSTLSAGELQRTRLTACLGHQLSGVCYILDEPTAGLHSRDTARLLKTLFQLRDEGNTVLLVEHDLDVIRVADRVIDLGPGAGTLGGRLVAHGTADELALNPESVTGRFLADRDARPLSKSDHDAPAEVSANFEGPSLRLTGATLHNLKDVAVEFPLNQIVCVAGVSGSGKTSLFMQTLVPAVRRALGERTPAGGPFLDLFGTENLSRLIRVDQSPIGRSARSNPATYSGIWDIVRRIFAKSKESRLRGYSARRFSLADPEARCPHCQGRGEVAVDEQQFSDWTTRCPECNGLRFSPATLSVRYRGQTVADVFEMNIVDAAKFFENFAKLARILTVFEEMGLGYLKLGQPATTLSGGEAQRIKLGTELAKSSPDGNATLFVLDEPTSGLHAADVLKLVRVLKRLVTAGHSVLVIEHNQEFLSHSDWIVEVGPGAGAAGGEIIASRPVQKSSGTIES